MSDADLIEKFRNHSYRSGWLARELDHAREAMTDALGAIPMRQPEIRAGLTRQIATITRTLAVIKEADKPALSANT